MDKDDITYYYDKHENCFVLTYYGALDKFDLYEEDTQEFVSERSAIIEGERLAEMLGVNFVERLKELE